MFLTPKGEREELARPRTRLWRKILVDMTVKVQMCDFDVDFGLAYEKVGLCGAPSHSFGSPNMSSIIFSMHAGLSR
jgi:hypothetical protein